MSGIMEARAPSARKGDWIQTYSGGQFWPLDPRADEIQLVDVAAGLSRDCRFGGHCLRFYSVAEHSVLMFHAARSLGFSSPAQRAALFHDASEGLGLRDMPRPIKRSLRDYSMVEHGVMVAVAERFSFDWPLDPAVKHLDERIGLSEQAYNMAPSPAPWAQKFEAIEPLAVDFQYWAPDVACAEFLRAASELGVS